MDDGKPDLCLGRGFYPAHQHLSFIVTDPSSDPSRVVVVNISSDQGRDDVGDTLPKGSHPHIKKTSHIRCDRAYMTDAASLAKRIRATEIRLTHCLDAPHLSNVQAALGKSRLVAREIQKALRDQGFIS